MTELRFHLYKSSAAQPYHWTIIVAQNGEVIATSENYVRKSDALHSMTLINNNAGSIKYWDYTGEN